MPGPSMVQIVGRSGSGKTLVIERVIARLRERGLRVAVLKHSHHRLDVPGKDTDRYRQSGANLILFASDVTALFADFDPLRILPYLPVDVVLVEGYGSRRLTRLRHRVDDPATASLVARRVLSELGGRRRRAPIWLDGRPAPARPLWEFVGNLMEAKRLRRIDAHR